MLKRKFRSIPRIERNMSNMNFFIRFFSYFTRRVAILLAALVLVRIGVIAQEVASPSSINAKVQYYLAKQSWTNLAEMGKAAVPALIQSLTDSDASVRAMVIGTLGQIGDRQAIGPIILRMKYDDDYGVRCKAVSVLAGFKYTPDNIDDKVYYLLAVADTENDDSDSGLAFREEKIAEIARLGQEAVTPLCNFLRLGKAAERNYKGRETYYTHDENFRFGGRRNRMTYAAGALGAIGGTNGGTNALQTLLFLADGRDRIPSGYVNVDDDFPVTCAAVEALGKLRNPEAIDTILRLMRHGNNHVIWSCVQALGDIGDARAAGPLGKLLLAPFHPDYWGGDYRPGACESLARIGAASVEPLISALKIDTVDVRLDVVSALARIGDKRAVKPLCELLLEDKESRVRAFAARALGELKDQSAVTPLIGALKDSDSQVRGDAAHALDSLGWKP
jgi:HEAT repeat protein